MRGDVWRALRPLLSLQPEAAAIYCIRFGAAAERYFANITGAEKANSQGQYTPRVDAVETHYEETV